MSFIGKLKSMFGSRESNAGDSFDVEKFVYVKIPGNIGPIDREELFEDPIRRALNEKGLGEISGGGSLLGDELEDGTSPVVFCGIDVDVTDLENALELLRDILLKANAPSGTELHYTTQGQPMQDVLNDGVWAIGEERTFLHPGFGF